ncbi:MAG TPA: cytochrome C oxidase subunit IV family protein [Rhodocyclaceae bacterium]|nr:cytochrome C oxidase subunit IV family protein [Rhodocyclaceae bacterium]
MKTKMNTMHPQAQQDFRIAVRRLGTVWICLIVLLLLSLGSSYIRLGIGNSITGLVIATIKSCLVLWFFMRLRSADALTRFAWIAALLILVLIFSLSGVDYATRITYPAPWQTPEQLHAPRFN